MSEPTTSAAAASPVADAVPGNWVDHLAPPSWRPYLRLARADRPIGSWLLMWPCWWAVALAGVAVGHRYPSPWLLLLFLVGAIVMRGAGCTYNDIVDREYDARVARTRSRPIPSGQVSVRQASIFLVAQLLVGLLVLLQLNWTTVVLGVSSLALIAIYPFMKRLTTWPQVVLGLTFKWGALVGWTAVTGSLAPPAVALYAGSVLWTIAYDTIYAHQDKEDDLALGLKSTAIRFGEATRPWLTGLYAAAVALWLGALLAAGAHWPGYLGLGAAAPLLAWQVATLDTADPQSCLVRFRSNRFVGVALFSGLVLDMALR